MNLHYFHVHRWDVGGNGGYDDGQNRSRDVDDGDRVALQIRDYDDMDDRIRADEGHRAMDYGQTVDCGQMGIVHCLRAALGTDRTHAVFAHWVVSWDDIGDVQCVDGVERTQLITKSLRRRAHSIPRMITTNICNETNIHNWINRLP